MARIDKQRITRWLNKKGERVKAGTRGARKVTEESAKWYAFDVPGYPAGKRIPLATNKDIAQRMLADLIGKGERGEAGLTDKAAESRDLLLAGLLTEFSGYLRDRGKTSEKQIALQEGRIKILVQGCDWKRVRDLDGSKAASWLATQRALPRKEGGISAQTSNYYRTHLRSWGKWLAKTGRVKANPFDELEAVNADLDRRHLRRDLDPEEIARLLKTTQESKRVFRGLDGNARAWLYLIASATGLRAKELGSLTPDHFDLDGDPPTVAVAKRKSKNKKGGLQPLPRLLVVALREWLATKGKNEPLWTGTWRDRAAKMLSRDLAACNPPIPYVVEGIDGPEFADLHSLRHFYVTAMSKEAPIKVAQLAARHGSLQVTEKYTHARLGEIAEAVNALPLNLGEGLAPLTQEQVATLAILGWTLVDCLLGHSGKETNGQKPPDSEPGRQG